MKLCQGTIWINPKDMLSEISKKKKKKKKKDKCMIPLFFGHTTRLVGS